MFIKIKVCNIFTLDFGNPEEGFTKAVLQSFH